MALFVAAEASRDRALGVRVVAEAVEASEHRAFNQTIFSSVAFLVAAEALYQPVLRLFFLLKISYHLSSFMQVILLCFQLLCILSRILLDSFLEVKVANELVRPASFNLISQQSAVI